MIFEFDLVICEPRDEGEELQSRRVEVFARTRSEAFDMVWLTLKENTRIVVSPPSSEEKTK